MNSGRGTREITKTKMNQILSFTIRTSSVRSFERLTISRFPIWIDIHDPLSKFHSIHSGNALPISYFRAHPHCLQFDSLIISEFLTMLTLTAGKS
jgi:hypothetical protein